MGSDSNEEKKAAHLGKEQSKIRRKEDRVPELGSAWESCGIRGKAGRAEVPRHRGKSRVLALIV